MNQDFSGPEEYLDHLEAFFEYRAADANGDRLPLTEHMLQSAACAANDRAPDSLVAAALLHDMGHWLNESAGSGNHEDGNLGHEMAGANYLEPYFGPDVTGPIALHVAAKRYLCAREPDYFSTLSIGSVRSLELQGGPMFASEAAHFEENPDYRSAVAVRRWDEYGKIPGLEVPRFAHYRPLLRCLLKPWLVN